MTPLTEHLAPFTDELRKNPRLRVGCWLIMGILLTYCVLVLRDKQQQVQQTYETIGQRWGQMQTLVKQTQWAERANQTKESRNQLEVRLWSGTTKGLAQATIQKWLDDQLKQLKIEGGRIIVDSAIDVPSYKGLWQVSAQIDANFNPRSLGTLLYEIAKYPQLIVIERLDIRAAQTSYERFSMMLKAYFQAPSKPL